MRAPAALGVLNYGWPMNGAAISPDGKLMATGDERGAVNVYDAATRHAVTPPYRIPVGLIQNVRFSPDGRTLAVSYLDNDDPEHPKFDLIDLHTSKRTLRVSLPALGGPPSPWIYTDVLFLPGGQDLLVRPVSGIGPAAPAPPVYRVDRKTGALTGRLELGRYTPYFYASETADGHVFITSLRDNATWELDPEALRVVRSWPVGGFAGAG